MKRITALQIMMRFIELKNLNTGYFFNMIIELSADGVPNVRFNAARTLVRVGFTKTLYICREQFVRPIKSNLCDPNPLSYAFYQSTP